MSNSSGVSELQQLTEDKTPFVQPERAENEPSNGDLAPGDLQDNDKASVITHSETTDCIEAEHCTHDNKDMSESTLSPTEDTNQSDENENNELPEEKPRSLSPSGNQDCAPPARDTCHLELAEEGESEQEPIAAGGAPFPGLLRDGSTEESKKVTSPKVIILHLPCILVKHSTLVYITIYNLVDNGGFDITFFFLT